MELVLIKKDGQDNDKEKDEGAWKMIFGWFEYRSFPYLPEWEHVHVELNLFNYL
jgi:hypothetical protein